MQQPSTRIATGAVTAAQGYIAGAVAAGIKESGHPDIALLVSLTPTASAAVFTTNMLQAAPVHVSREHIQHHNMQAAVVNAGNANCATGTRGEKDARTMAQLASERAGCDPQEVFVNSTGVIGHFLPMDKVISGIDAVSLSAEGGAAFARAIMTTDTFPKERVEQFEVDEIAYHVGGCAKGAGMIHPNMATMLAFLTTDAPIAPEALQDHLRWAVDHSFNMVTVDGDTSTNDSVLLLANGAAGGTPITDPTADAGRAFGKALMTICTSLAKDIARDGEGATKLIEVEVIGAITTEAARTVARSIVRSPLLKAALSKGDPNWGRALVAAGYADVPFDPDAVRLWMGGQLLFDTGSTTDIPEPEAAAAVSGEVVSIKLDLGQGNAEATAWGCDLTEEYVRFNSDYVT